MAEWHYDYTHKDWGSELLPGFSARMEGRKNYQGKILLQQLEA